MPAPAAAPPLSPADEVPAADTVAVAPPAVDAPPAAAVTAGAPPADASAASAPEADIAIEAEKPKAAKPAAPSEEQKGDEKLKQAQAPAQGAEAKPAPESKNRQESKQDEGQPALAETKETETKETKRAPAPEPRPEAPRIETTTPVRTGGEQNVAQTTTQQPAAPVQAPAVQAPPAAATPIPVAGLAIEITAQSRAGKNRFEIRLDPPELGRIDVRLDVDRDGRVTSRLIVERVETLDMLRRDAPQLERALEQAGLKTSDNGLQFSLRDQSPQNQNRDQGNPRAAHLIVPDAEIAETAQRQYGRLSGLGGGLDIRV